MTLKKLYEEIGGNYQDITERLVREERIKKFVLLFLKDQSYQTFLKAMEQGNEEEAFRAIHTLKGVCMNLSFDNLFQISSKITEYLREKDIKSATEALPDLDKCYERHFQAICAYANS